MKTLKNILILSKNKYMRNHHIADFFSSQLLLVDQMTRMYCKQVKGWLCTEHINKNLLSVNFSLIFGHNVNPRQSLAIYWLPRPILYILKFTFEWFSHTWMPLMSSGKWPMISKLYGHPRLICHPYNGQSWLQTHIIGLMGC